jgi:hypothetical protein
MALSAQERFPDFQELVVDRTVGVVAGGAFVGDIAVFEKERSGFFGMAAPAGFPFVDFVQLFRVGGAVGIVAVDAVHLDFFYRMMARQ